MEDLQATEHRMALASLRSKLSQRTLASQSLGSAGETRRDALYAHCLFLHFDRISRQDLTNKHGHVPRLCFWV